MNTNTFYHHNWAQWKQFHHLPYLYLLFLQPSWTFINDISFNKSQCGARTSFLFPLLLSWVSTHPRWGPGSWYHCCWFSAWTLVVATRQRQWWVRPSSVVGWFIDVGVIEYFYRCCLRKTVVLLFRVFDYWVQHILEIDKQVKMVVQVQKRAGITEIIVGGFQNV